MVIRLIIDDSFLKKGILVYQAEQIRRHCYVKKEKYQRHCDDCNSSHGNDVAKLCPSCKERFDKVASEIEWVKNYGVSVRNFFNSKKGHVLFVENATFVPTVIVDVFPVSLEDLGSHIALTANDHS